MSGLVHYDGARFATIPQAITFASQGMTKISYKGNRFPREIIQQAIWLYLRLTLSFRDVEELLAERGIMVTRKLFGAG